MLFLPMRVIFICPELRDRGGNFLVAELARRLPAYGWDVEIATLVGRGDKAIREGSEALWHDVNVTPIPVDAEKKTLDFIYEATSAIVSFLEKKEADVYVADGGLPPAGLRFSNKRPALIFNQGLQHFSQLNYGAEDPQKFLFSKMDKVIRSLGLLTGIPIVTVSEPHKREMEHLNGKMDYTVIEPGLASDFFDVHKSNYSLNPPIVFATSGASLADKGKGFALLVDSLNLLHQEGLNFVLKIYSTDFQPSNFSINFPYEVKGMSNPKDLAKALSEADIYLNASMYETFCLSIAEAMAIGLPCVITNAVGPMAYANTSNAMIIEERSPQNFCGAIKTLLDVSESDRQKIGEAARVALSDYTLENMASGWDRVLRQTMNGQK